MTRTEIIEKLTAVFRDVFDENSIVIHEGMTAKDVKKWDSITHIDLICAVESKFNIRLTTRQVTGLKNVGDLITVIEEKAKAA